MRFLSNRNPGTLPLQFAPPGTLTAHERFHLVLLCSHPDTVHGFSLRKTQTSTPLIKGSYTGASPRSSITPTRADCGYRAPLTPRLHGLISILFFGRFVNRRPMTYGIEYGGSKRKSPCLRKITDDFQQTGSLC